MRPDCLSNGTIRRVAWLPPRQVGVVPRGLLCAAAMVLSTLGCESTPPPEVEDTALVTDGTSFRLDTVSWRDHLWYRGQVPYSFTNRTGSRVYVFRDCRGTIRRGLLDLPRFHGRLVFGVDRV